MTDAIFGTDGIRGRAYEGWLGLEATIFSCAAWLSVSP